MYEVPRPSSAAAFTVLATLLACSNGNSPAPAMPAPPLLQIAAYEPASGSAGVGIRSPVSVAFGEELDLPSDADFEVDDDLGPLAGIRSYDANTLRWTWTPLFELPRGATLHAVLGTGLRGRSGSALPAPVTWTFTVRDGAVGSVDALGPTLATVPVFAATARTGLAAIASGEMVYEWNGAHYLGAPVTTGFGSITGFLSAGPGQLAALCARIGPAGFELSIARRPGQAAWQFETFESRGSLVLGLARLQANLRGDLLAYWYGTNQMLSADAAWSSSALLPSWSFRTLPAAPPFTVRATAVDGLGATWFSHVDPQASVLAVERQNPTAGTAASQSLPLAAVWRLGADGAGTGLVVAQTNAGGEDVLSLFRSQRGSAFGPPATLAHAATLALVDFAVADCGEGVVLYHQPAGGPLQGRRIDAAGGLGAPYDLALDAPVLAMAPRGETWLVEWRASVTNATEKELVAVRWRPGRAPEPRLVIATEPAGSVFGPLAAAVDESGRAAVAWAAGTSSQALVLRAVRFE